MILISVAAPSVQHAYGVKTGLLSVYSHEVGSGDYSFDTSACRIDIKSDSGTRVLEKYDERRVWPGGAMREPRWSPDGSTVAFLADDRTGRPHGRSIGIPPDPHAFLRLWVAETTTRTVNLLTPGKDNWSWNPGVWATARLVIAQRANELETFEKPSMETLFSFDVKTGLKKRLGTAAVFSELQPLPNSDGKVAYCSVAGVVALDPKTASSHMLYANLGNVLSGSIAFSPDAHFLLLNHADRPGGTSQSLEIYDLRLGKSAAKFNRPDGAYPSAAWSGALGGFVTNGSSWKSKESQLILVRPDGQEKNLISIPGQVEVRTVTDSGKYVIVRRLTQDPGKPLGPDDVWAYDPVSGTLTLLLHSAKPIQGFDVIRESDLTRK